MTALYNENDPYAAAWLGNLVAEGHIAPGRVDTRSIVDLRPADLDGVVQFHAFAGIGGWSLALRLSGIPDDFPVWTGSCPCQPFSAAGRQRGLADERHLWPAWFRLIRECRPAIVVGEQVEAAVRLGWLDAVFADLEAEGYACGPAVLGAHSVGSPHIRQRTWFVADARGDGHKGAEPAGAQADRGRRSADACGAPIILAEPSRIGSSRREGSAGLAGRNGAEAGGATFVLADTAKSRRGAQPLRPAGTLRRSPEEPGRLRDAGPWADLEWLPCRDGKARPTQPGLQPLAHGVSARVGRLRAAGNAIVPQVAAEFLIAALALTNPPSPDDTARAGSIDHRGER